MVRRLTRLQLAADIGIAVVCLLGRLLWGFDALALMVVVGLMAVALAIRRLSPALALSVAWLGAMLQILTQNMPDLANLAILAVLYSTARYGTPAVKWLGLVSAGVGSLIAAVYMAVTMFGFGGMFEANSGTGQAWFGFAVWLIGMLAALGLSWTLGLLAKTWREARDAQIAKTLAQEKVVVEQERNRIARDMHDVVAHSLAVVIAQADGARYARATDPEAADAALVTIAATAREALGDVRGLLGQLRHSQSAGPQPAMSDLAALLDQLRASGLDVRFEQSGVEASLPQTQQLAVYRITQEALTNALRHGSAAAPVTLSLDWQGDKVALQITNQLRGGAPAETRVGHGTTGMRERAVLGGGALDAGPRGADYVVSATIPFTRGAPQ